MARSKLEFFDKSVDLKSARKALAAVRDRYRSAFHAADDAIFMMYGPYILECNARTVELFGCEDESEIVDQSAWQFSPETQPDGAKTSEKSAEIYSKAIKGIPQRFYWRHLRKDGTVFDADVSLSPLSSTDKLLQLAVVRDVTAQKKAEVELRQARAYLDAALEQSPAGILIADAPDVRIRTANPAALEIRGSAEEDLTGIAVEEHSSRWQTFGPDGTPWPSEDLPLSRAVLRGETSRNVEVIIRRAGKEDRWMLVNAAPIRNSQDEVEGGIVVFADVTDYKRAEYAIARQAEFGALLAELSSRFVNLDSDRVDDEINLWLHRLADYLKADRSTVWQQVEGYTGLTLTHSWTRPEFPQRLSLKDDSFPWLKARLLRGEVNCFPRIADMPAEASGDREALEGVGGIGHLSVPIASQNQLLGALTFGTMSGEADWTLEQAEKLRLAAEVFANAILRRRAEDEVNRATAKLRQEREALQQKNIALREILNHMEREKAAFKQEMGAAVDYALAPFVEKLRSSGGSVSQKDIEQFEETVASLSGGDLEEFSKNYEKLTPREKDICELIAQGLSSKEIAGALNIDLLTVQKHRSSIRRKLQLKGRKINLSSYLRSK